MATQQMIDIVIKASDKASSIADQVDQRMKKLGNDTAKANNQAAKSTQTLNKSLLQANDSLQVVGAGSVHAAQMLQRVRMDPNFGSSVNRAKLELSQMGVNINSVSGRFRVLTSASQIAFTRLKTKVSETASTIKGKLTTALNGLKAKLQKSASHFDGLGNTLSNLKGIFENFAGDLVYDFVMGIGQMAKESINAASQLDYFGQRLYKLSGDVHLSKQGFEDFKESLTGLQQEFRKIDMTSVGATAEELAVKMKLPSQELGNLTRMTAVLSSTLVKEGHTQEDSVLAVSDALDGQFMRLKEIGIGQKELMENGWSGDINDKVGLIQALNNTLDDMGFTETARDITTVDEAISSLQIAFGQLLQKVLVPLTPLIIGVVEGLLKISDAIGGVISALGGMPDWAKLGSVVAGIGLAIAGVSTAITMELIPSLSAMLAPLSAAILSAWEFAAALLANPLTWVALALAGIVVVIYEVGKAFGWWTDVNSMLQSIWAGLQRLWSAFVNHPDVQGLINGIKSAWANLQPYIASVINWVKSFFATSGNKNFDVVRFLIDSVSKAWDQMTAPIKLVINTIKLVINWFKKTYATGKSNLDKIKALFKALPNAIRSAISTLVNIITKPFKDAYSKVKGVVDDIKSKAKSITSINIGSVTNKLTQPFSKAYDKIKGIVSDIVKKAKSIPSNIPVVGGLFGGNAAGFDYLGMLEEMGSPAQSTADTPIELDHTINFNFDFNNLPTGIDQDQLTMMLRSAITDQTVIKQLVNNPDFQDLDSKVKNKIILKNNRARGV